MAEQLPQRCFWWHTDRQEPGQASTHAWAERPCRCAPESPAGRGANGVESLPESGHWPLAAGVGLTGATRLAGILGDPVAHSRSPAMHNAAFRVLGLDWCYVPLHVVPARLEAALRGLAALGFVGTNVTIPHKEAVARLVDELTPAARAIGAVNTLTVQADGRLQGDNTDAGGALAALAEAGVEVAGRRAVVLGAGGAARAVAYALCGAGAYVVLANRTPARATALAAALAPHAAGLEAIALSDAAALQRSIAQAALLVNATSAGMHPGPEVSPLPDGVRLEPHLAVMDLVYAPRRTRLLADAAAAGCRTVEGLRMLVHQGALAFERWTGRPAPLDVMSHAVLGDLQG